MSREHRCTLFLHVPKTGGKTIAAVLRSKYPAEILYLNSLWDPLEKIGEIPLRERGTARVATGHFHYGVHEYIPQPCDYITVLREPVARVLSLYRFIRGNPKHWLHDELTRSRMSLEQFVESAADPGVDNEQTRMIAGAGAGEVLRLSPTGGRERKEPPDLDRAALEQAKRNLDRFLVVGLTERFDESFILIRRALGWKLPMYETRNVSKGAKPPPPSERALELIRDRNRLDLELYDHAEELLATAVHRQGWSFQREVAAFKALNQIPNALAPRIPARMRHPLRALLPR
jgi:Galactose-3-O-sulfotransferase